VCVRVCVVFLLNLQTIVGVISLGALCMFAYVVILTKLCYHFVLKVTMVLHLDRVHSPLVDNDFTEHHQVVCCSVVTLSSLFNTFVMCMSVSQ